MSIVFIHRKFVCNYRNRDISKVKLKALIDLIRYTQAQTRHNLIIYLIFTIEKQFKCLLGGPHLKLTCSRRVVSEGLQIRKPKKKNARGPFPEKAINTGQTTFWPTLLLIF